MWHPVWHPTNERWFGQYTPYLSENITIYDLDDGLNQTQGEVFEAQISLGTYGVSWNSLSNGFDWRLLESELQEYHVQFVNDTTTNWTIQEKTDFRAGIQRTGEALQLLLNEIGRPANSPQEAFNRVMVAGLDNEPILFIRTSQSSGNLTVTYDGTELTYLDIGIACKAYGYDTGTHRPSAIICSDAMNSDVNDMYREQTAVHELGHLLDYRSGNELQTRMESNVNDTQLTLLSCVSVDNGSFAFVITGYDNFNKSWKYGQMGWGSDPSIFSEFVRHPNPKVDEQLRESAADMFLNWVYRRSSSAGSTQILLTNGQPSQGCVQTQSQSSQYPVSNQPQNWQGFWNIRWNWFPEYLDWGYSGDIRYVYMDNVVKHLLSLFPTW